MTTLTLSAASRAPAARPSQLAVLTALSCTLLVLTAAWALADTRTLDGMPVWAKPAKFALSFVVLFGTLAWIERRLSPAWRQGLALPITVAVMAAAMVTEMGYMIVMAAQQQLSHFNFSSRFTTAMYSVMGLGAVSLMVGVAVFGVVALRDRDADFGPALRRGVGWGAILSAVLTLVTAGTMSSLGTHVGMASAGAPTVPFLGWSGTRGDIRPAHFLALHAMQVLPLAGAAFDRLGVPVTRMAWVALAYGALTLAVFAQALAGLPLVRL